MRSDERTVKVGKIALRYHRGDDNFVRLRQKNLKKSQPWMLVAACMTDSPCQTLASERVKSIPRT